MLELLKTAIKRIPLPEVKIAFEDLKYEESRELYKLSTVLNYFNEVEDAVSVKRFMQLEKELEKTRKILRNLFNIMIYITEEDSFYRKKVRYALMLMKSDLMMAHYFKLIKEHGMVEKFDGKTVWNLTFTPAGGEKEGYPKNTYEQEGPFKHLMPYLKKMEEKK